MEKEKEGFPITSLREINMLLKAGDHENVVRVRVCSLASCPLNEMFQEIVVGSNMDKIYLVMDYVEHDMKSLMESLREPFLTGALHVVIKSEHCTIFIGQVKTLLHQLLSGVHHLHDNWILHRDLKTSNLLLSHRGILKIGDFGLAREYDSPLKPYTPIVVTLWYRAPELLLGVKVRTSSSVYIFARTFVCSSTARR
jgi:cell division cycle 2-like protein